jgi:hypothetical protein
LYKASNLHVAIPCGKDWETCENLDYECHTIAKDGEPVAYLNHSCDEWIIGSSSEIKTMARDLLALAEMLDKTP